MTNNSFVTAVIVAAGSSSRMKSQTSKQLMHLLSKPVLVHTVTAFSKSNSVDEIIIVCPSDNIEKFKSVLSMLELNIPIKFTAGGEQRQQSVANGVALADERCTLLAIHDGARPLIFASDIDKIIADGKIFGAASLGVPVKDTIKLVSSESTVESTPQRDKLWIIQTPQVFDKNLYKKALQKSIEENKNFTDDCQLVENIGAKVHITLGDYSNIKITTPEDIAIAEALLKLRGNYNENRTRL